MVLRTLPEAAKNGIDFAVPSLIEPAVIEDVKFAIQPFAVLVYRTAPSPPSSITLIAISPICKSEEEGADVLVIFLFGISIDAM